MEIVFLKQLLESPVKMKLSTGSLSRRYPAAAETHFQSCRL